MFFLVFQYNSEFLKDILGRIPLSVPQEEFLGCFLSLCPFHGVFGGKFPSPNINSNPPEKLYFNANFLEFLV